MAFTSPEFPGMTFESIEELRAARETRRELQDALSGRTVVTVSDVEKGTKPWGVVGPDTKT